MEERQPENQQDMEKQLEMLRQLEIALRQILEPKAKERLSNVRLVNPELYYKVVQTLFQMYQSGQIFGKVSEEMVIRLLRQMQPRREFRIVRK